MMFVSCDMSMYLHDRICFDRHLLTILAERLEEHMFLFYSLALYIVLGMVSIHFFKQIKT